MTKMFFTIIFGLGGNGKGKEKSEKKWQRVKEFFEKSY